MAQLKISAEEPLARFAQSSSEDRSMKFGKMLIASEPVFVSKEPKGLDFVFHVPNIPVPMQEVLAICRTLDEHEANLIFYSSNLFNFVDSNIQRENSVLEAFLHSLSPNYASLLSRISISFPALYTEQGKSGESKLSSDGMQNLKLLQTSCTQLKTLELAVHRCNSFGYVGYVGHVENALLDCRLKGLFSKISEELRLFPLLKSENIIIRSFVNLDPQVEKLMNGLNWEVNTNKCKPY